jgi:hypothetical protein
MKILVACEESQAVTIELRKLGHEAYSCDLLECSGGHPEWHIQGDAIKEAYSGKYEIMIAFPPCTDLAVSGAAWFEQKRKDGRQEKSIQFFMDLMKAPIDKICIENPVGIMSGIYREPDQIIQPYFFGDEAQKSTCLWLKNLNKLEPTNIVGKGKFKTSPSGKKYAEWVWNTGGGSGKARSKTFPGIAKAMAEQFTQPLKQTEINFKP